MSSVSSLIYKGLLNPAEIGGGIARILVRNKFISDETAIKTTFKSLLGYELNLDCPTTFNEKLQWLKLNDHREIYTTMVDKYLAKQWAANIIGEKYIVPSLASWNSAEEIDTSILPDRFVLKTNHDQGGVVVCANKDSFDLAVAKKKLSRHLKRNLYWYGREWPYLNVRALVFAEQFLYQSVSDNNITDIENSTLFDYKVLCFGGKPAFIQLHKGRGGFHTQDIYDTNWNLTDIVQPDTPLSGTLDPAPEQLDEMLELSARLSEGLPHLRVDWYSTSEGLKLGELTLYDGSGFCMFSNIEHDRYLGSLIDLSQVSARRNK